MNEVKEFGNNDVPSQVEGIEITPLNQVDPINDGGEGGYLTLTIVLTICA